MSDLEFEALFDQIQKLTTAERLRMMELLTATLQADFARQADWHTALQSTYGILADDPIERPPELPLEDREMVE